MLTELIESFRTRLTSEIDSLEITDGTNISNLMKQLIPKYTIEPLVLHEPIISEPRETYRLETGSRGGTYRIRTYEIKVTVPYDGNNELFECHPSSSIIVYLGDNVQIQSKNVIATIILNELNSETFQSIIDKIIADLSINIPKDNSEIAPWNNGLENYIKSLLENRKGVVAKKLDFMEKIGLKVNPRSNEFMIPPPIAKKVIPIPVSETTKNVKKEFIPILQDEVYKDIKEVLYNVGKAIERKLYWFTGNRNFVKNIMV
jgi:hypothetical protein